MDLRAKYCVPHAALNLIARRYREIISESFKCKKGNTNTMLLKKLETQFTRTKFFKEKFEYFEGNELYVGHRNEVRIN